MLPLCQAEGKAVTPWSPLARGYLAGSGLGKDAFERDDGARPHGQRRRHAEGRHRPGRDDPRPAHQGGGQAWREARGARAGLGHVEASRDRAHRRRFQAASHRRCGGRALAQARRADDQAAGRGLSPEAGCRGSSKPGDDPGFLLRRFDRAGPCSPNLRNDVGILGAPLMRAGRAASMPERPSPPRQWDENALPGVERRVNLVRERQPADLVSRRRHTVIGDREMSPSDPGLIEAAPAGLSRRAHPSRRFRSG